MAHVSYHVSGKLNDEWVRKRFSEAKVAKDFARTLDNPTTTYEVRARVNGREVSRSFKRRADADAFGATTEADKVRGGAIDPRDARVTVGDYADQWLASRTDLAETTRELYHHLLSKHIKPALGAVPIGTVTVALVRSWHAGIDRPSTAAKAYRLLRTIMYAAVEDRRRLDNPCKVKGADQEPESDRPTASFAEVKALAEAMPAHLRLLVLLASWVSLRKGELLGLCRADIDLLHNEVKIRETETYTLSRRRVRKGPKSKAGKRELSIPPEIVDGIKYHLDNHVGPHADSPIFDCTPTELRGAWERARRAIGRPELHLHDLRGAGLTWAAIAGATTAELMYRAGHSTPTMVMRYQRATKDRDRALAQAMADLARPAAVVPIAPRDARGTRAGRG